MSCLRLAKELLLSKKAWKSITNTLRTKFHKLKNSKAIKKTSRRLIAIRSIHRRGRPLVSHNHRTFNRPFSALPHNHHQGHHYRHHQMNFSSIYVDELFGEVDPYTNHPHAPGETNVAKEINAAKGVAVANKEKFKAKADMTIQQKQSGTEKIEVVPDGKALVRKSKKVGEKGSYDVDDAWKAIVARSPQLRGVDERADEFISKFRKEMKLQKDKSIIDYQDMLNRSS